MRKFTLLIASLFLTIGAMAQTLTEGSMITAADFTAATEAKKIAIKNGNGYWLSEGYRNWSYGEADGLASSETLTSNEVFLWEPAGDGTFYLKKLCAAPEEGYVYLTDNATSQGNGAKTLGIGNKTNALKFTAIHPSSSGSNEFNYTASDNENFVRFYNSDNSNWINCENKGETASFRNNPGKGAYTAHLVYDMDAYKLVTINFVKDGETTTEYKLYTEGETITFDIPAYEGYTYETAGSTTKDATDTQVITVTYSTEPEPEPTGPTSYILNPITASSLMAKETATRIAIRNVAFNNHNWLDIKNSVDNNSPAEYSDDVIFIWEPVTEGTSGTYRIKDLEGNYLQNDGLDQVISLGTIDNAAVFKAVQPTLTGSNSTLFSYDNASKHFSEGNQGDLVRFVALSGDNYTTEVAWINTQKNNERAKYNKGAGTFTIHYAYELVETDEFTADFSTAEYASFYAPSNVIIPENVEAYYLVTGGVTSEKATLTKIENGIIPAYTGVILKSSVSGGIALKVTKEEATEDISGNLFKGTVAERIVDVSSNTNAYAYVLAKHEESVGLYKSETTSVTNQYTCVTFINKANKAYLPASAVPAAAASSNGFRFDFSDGTTTEIEKVEMRNEKEEIFDLQGRRINEITCPGIYIVNGKKTLVK